MSEATGSEVEKQAVVAVPPSSSAFLEEEPVQLQVSPAEAEQGREGSAVSETPLTPLEAAEPVAVEYPRKTLAESSAWATSAAVLTAV